MDLPFIGLLSQLKHVSVWYHGNQLSVREKRKCTQMTFTTLAELAAWMIQLKYILFKFVSISCLLRNNDYPVKIVLGSFDEIMVHLSF